MGETTIILLYTLSCLSIHTYLYIWISIYGHICTCIGLQDTMIPDEQTIEDFSVYQGIDLLYEIYHVFSYDSVYITNFFFIEKRPSYVRIWIDVGDGRNI